MRLSEFLEESGAFSSEFITEVKEGSEITDISNFILKYLLEHLRFRPGVFPNLGQSIWFSYESAVYKCSYSQPDCKLCKDILLDVRCVSF